MKDRLVLIDTSVWIWALRREYHPLVKDKVEGLLAQNKVAIVPMVYLELLGGTKSEAEFRRLRSRLKALHQVPCGEREWEEAAQLAFRLRRSGKSIPYTDVLIASTAFLHDLLLLHADRHFDLIAEEIPLKTESLVPLMTEVI